MSESLSKVTSDYSNNALLGAGHEKGEAEWPLVKNVVGEISASGEWLSYTTSKVLSNYRML